MMRAFGRLLFVIVLLFGAAAEASPVLLISVDGLRPADILQTDRLGLGLRRHGDIGVIDMRAIAPSVARILGVDPTSAELPAAF